MRGGENVKRTLKMLFLLALLLLFFVSLVVGSEK